MASPSNEIVTTPSSKSQATAWTAASADSAAETASGQAIHKAPAAARAIPSTRKDAVDGADEAHARTRARESPVNQRIVPGL
jgi:hypothetical protein